MLILLGMELELPSRLYGEGLEPQVKKIDNSCRLKLLELLKEKMEPEFDEELMTRKRHEKWFTFARRPLRFGLQEYHAVTGLKVKQEKNSGLVTWKDDDGFWSKQIKTNGKINLQIIKKKHLEESNTWAWVDRVRLIYLCVIMGVVMGKDEKVNIPHLYMKLAMDLENLRNYPWGLYSFDFLLKQIDKTRHKLEQKEGAARKKNVLCQLAASSKGNIDTDMKNFLEGLVQASFTTFGEKFCQQFSERLGKIETEVTQLRTASERTEQFETIVTDSDQASGPSMTKMNTDPSTSKKGTAPSKKRPTYDVTDEPPAELSVNMGALFSQMLFERKFRGLRPLDKKPLDESIGSLLTQIFKHHDINLSDTPCVDTIDRFDAQFFLNTKILHSSKIYRFTMPDGTILHCKLLQPAITSLTSVENMEFMPPTEVLYTPPPPASKRRRGSSSSGPAQTQCEDDTILDISVDHTPDPSMEYLLPPYTSQFDSGRTTILKLSTMMQTVWGALAKIRCPPTPSCCRAPQILEAAGMAGDTPDVVGPLDEDDAGDEPSDEAADAERGSRLHRSRRAP
uniref:Uncharacterized protein n=1 Tax=Brassica oleracea var. oleracea TaxID=109376 RepID=A0A0D3BWQ5_BRAOL